MGHRADATILNAVPRLEKKLADTISVEAKALSAKPPIKPQMKNADKASSYKKVNTDPSDPQIINPYSPTNKVQKRYAIRFFFVIVSFSSVKRKFIGCYTNYITQFPKSKGGKSKFKYKIAFRQSDA